MRAFVGTVLGTEAQAACAGLVADIVRRHDAVLRGIPAGSAHLTYAFVGAFDGARQEPVADALRRVAASREAIRVTLAGPRVLTTGSSPRLVFAEVVDGADALRHLADDIAAVLGEALPGTAIDRMKSAHVTLARFRRQATRSDGRAVAATLAEPRFAASTVTERIATVQLVSSTLTPSGSVYTVLASCALS